METASIEKRELNSILLGLEADLLFGPLLEEEKNDEICGGCGRKASGFMATFGGNEAVCCEFCASVFTQARPQAHVKFYPRA